MIVQVYIVPGKLKMRRILSWPSPKLCLRILGLGLSVFAVRRTRFPPS